MDDDVISPSLKERGFKLVSLAMSVRVTDDRELMETIECIISATTVRKLIENKFEEATKAAHEAHKKMLAVKNEATANLIEAERLMRAAVLSYISNKEVAYRRFSEEKGGKDSERYLPATLDLQLPDGAKIRKVTKYRVTNAEELIRSVYLGMYPLEFVQINEKAIKEYIQKSGELPVGVEQYKENVLVIDGTKTGGG